MPWDPEAKETFFPWKDPNFRSQRDLVLACGQVLARELGFSKAPPNAPLVLPKLLAVPEPPSETPSLFGPPRRRLSPRRKKGLVPLAISTLEDWRQQEPKLFQALFPGCGVAGPALVATLGAGYLMEGMPNDFGNLTGLLRCCDPCPSSWLSMVEETDRLVRNKDALLFSLRDKNSIGPCFDVHFGLTPLGMELLGIPPVDLHMPVLNRLNWLHLRRIANAAKAPPPADVGNKSAVPAEPPNTILSLHESSLSLARLVLPEEQRLELQFVAKILQKDPKATPVMLFHGPPGTGKTFAAKCLAGEVKRPLGTASLDQLHSKWYGESEKALRLAFTEAEQKGAILLIDEADALLWDRSSSQASWQLAEVNLLLKFLEAPPVPVVMCTNLLRVLDSAVHRRIHHLIEFPLPGFEERHAIWASELWDRKWRDGIDVDALAAVPITGGLIANALHQADRRVTVFAGSFAINTENLLRLAEKELLKMGREVLPKQVGFSAPDIDHEKAS